MAKRNNNSSSSNSTTNYGIIKFCAFWGIVLAAIAALLSFVFSLVNYLVEVHWAGRVIGICNTVSQIALLIAVILPAYKYVAGKNKGYKILFWIAVILLVLGLVGINLAF